jgi:hypothetical protein
MSGILKDLGDIVSAPSTLQNTSLTATEQADIAEQSRLAQTEIRDLTDWSCGYFNDDSPDPHTGLDEVLPVIEKEYGVAATAVGLVRYLEGRKSHATQEQIKQSWWYPHFETVREYVREYGPNIAILGVMGAFALGGLSRTCSCINDDIKANEARRAELAVSVEANQSKIIAEGEALVARYHGLTGEEQRHDTRLAFADELNHRIKYGELRPGENTLAERNAAIRQYSDFLIDSEYPLPTGAEIVRFLHTESTESGLVDVLEAAEFYVQSVQKSAVPTDVAMRFLEESTETGASPMQVVTAAYQLFSGDMEKTTNTVESK